jgi:hypothetical protein
MDAQTSPKGELGVEPDPVALLVFAGSLAAALLGGRCACRTITWTRTRAMS